MKLFAKVIGILGLFIGLLSLTPLKGGDGLLLGIFQVNTQLQALIHLVTGAAAIWFITRSDQYNLSKFVKVTGIFYTLLALFGIGGLAQGVASYSSIAGVIYVNLPTELLHLVIGIWGIYAGFIAKPEGVLL